VLKLINDFVPPIIEAVLLIPLMMKG